MPPSNRRPYNPLIGCVEVSSFWVVVLLRARVENVASPRLSRIQPPSDALGDVPRPNLAPSLCVPHPGLRFPFRSSGSSLVHLFG